MPNMALVKRGQLWFEIIPTHCPAGHEVRPDRVLIGWDGTKRTYWCVACKPGG